MHSKIPLIRMITRICYISGFMLLIAGLLLTAVYSPALAAGSLQESTMVAIDPDQVGTVDPDCLCATYTPSVQDTEPASTEPAGTEPAVTETAGTEPAETETAVTDPTATETAVAYPPPVTETAVTETAAAPTATNRPNNEKSSLVFSSGCHCTCDSVFASI